MVIRKSFVYLMEINTVSVLYTIELVVGIIVPLRMFFSRTMTKSIPGLFIASSLVILGVLLNRLNNFVVAYTPPYATGPYIPSVGEILVTLGFVALEVLIYRAAVMIFPIISQPKPAESASKYSVKGV